MHEIDRSRRRILIIGGLPTSLLNFRWPLISAIAEKGHQVIACAADPHPLVNERLRSIGGVYYPIHMRRASLNPFDDIRTFFALSNIIKKTRPDAVLAYTIKPVVYGLIAARIHHVPHRYAMITGLGYAFTESEQKSLSRIAASTVAFTLYKRSLKTATHVFFQNPDDKELFLKKRLVSSTSWSIVNGSGVDTDYYFPVPLPDDPVFLLIARLLKDKGIREYVAAAEAVKKDYPNARFLLAGPLDSNPSSITRAEVEKWTSTGTVEYLGELDDVRPAIAQSSIYVLPSYREGTPRTVLEAMSMGRPVITTDAPGCKETVEPEVNGILVPPREVPKLAAAMKKLAASRELRLQYGSRGREIVKIKYDSRLVADSILEKMVF